MKTLSKKAEQEILAAISDVCDEVSNGRTPTDAAIKVAKDRNLSRNFTKLMLTGYNTGATTYQREKGGSVLEKLAEFPIAVEEKVLEAVFPSAVLQPVAEKNASAVSDVYSKPPRLQSPKREAQALEKVASLQLTYPEVEQPRQVGDSKIAMERAYGQAQREKNKIAAARHAYTDAQERFMRSLGQAADYFKQGSYERQWSYEDADALVRHKYGSAATAVMDYIYSRNKCKEPRGQQIKSAGVVDWAAQPFCLIERCIEEANEVVSTKKAYYVQERESKAKMEDLLRPFLGAESPQNGDHPSRKEASLLGGAVGGALSQSLREAFSPKTPTDMVSGAVDDLQDPAIDQELQAIRAQATLHDLLANDEIISGYDQDEVIEAFNEMSAMAPRAATQPAAMRAMLRKRLAQGVLEPFETKELTEIEKTMNANNAGLQDVQRTTSILG